MGPVSEAAASPPRAALYVKFTPVSADCVAVRGQLSMAAYEQLRHVHALLGHRIPSGNAALVIEHALKLALDLLEKRKFAKGVCARPRDGKPNGRYVPAHVRQAVCERDGGRCTFTGPDGTRCGAESQLEFDHIVTFAEGGATTVENLRLLCRKHNQYEAKRVFGKERVARARELAQRTRARDKAAAAASAERARARQEQAKAPAARERLRKQERSDVRVLASTAAAPTTTGSAVSSPVAQEHERPCDAIGTTASPVAPRLDDEPARAYATPNAETFDPDVIAALRGLRFTLPEARQGAALCAHMTESPLAERVRTALQGLGRAHAHRTHRSAGGD